MKVYIVYCTEYGYHRKTHKAYKNENRARCVVTHLRLSGICADYEVCELVEDEDVKDDQ